MYLLCDMFLAISWVLPDKIYIFLLEKYFTLISVPCFSNLEFRIPEALGCVKQVIEQSLYQWKRLQTQWLTITKLIQALPETSKLSFQSSRHK